MWKYVVSVWLAAAGSTALAGCSGPACVRNSQCVSAMECRDNMCQRPLPEPPAPVDAGYPYVCRRGFYCGTGGNSTASTAVGGRAPVNTSNRYQDAGAADSGVAGATSLSGGAMNSAGRSGSGGTKPAAGSSGNTRAGASGSAGRASSADAGMPMDAGQI
jgi:hypothetical protein